MYKYLDHQSDMGIYSQAENWLRVFEDGAKAVFELMFEKKLKIRNEKSGKFKIRVSAKDIPHLFIEWLNELIAQKDIENLVFTEFKINKLEKQDDKYILEAKVGGKKFNPEKFEQKTEVKAATYSGLKCGEKNGDKFCQCVVDM